jgi:GT2 family glycosyltransferase
MSNADRMRAGYHNLCRPEILDLIPTTAKSILDLGCGTGELGKALKKRQTCIVDGIELNKEAAHLAKTNLDTVHIDNLNRFCPCFIKRKYDVLVFGDILEHLISPWEVVRKFTTLLNDDGIIIASIPNVAHPSVVSQLQRGLFRYAVAGILDITHLRFFTQTTIFQLFYRAGLKIVNIRPYPAVTNPIQYLVTAVKPKLEHKIAIATVLILTYNGWRFTKQCIDSIKQRTFAPYHILVIDNGSTDETVQELRKDRTIFHIENTCNQGFARGMNIGIELVHTPFFVLSNSDVVVTLGWLSMMLKHMKTDKDLMVLGPRSNYVSGPQECANVPYKTDAEMLKYAESRTANITTPLSYFFRIVFFFALFRTETILRVGFLDERFALSNYEDDDYCMQIASKNLRAAYDNTVFIHHWGRVTFKENKRDWNNELSTNRAIFMAKWGLKEYGPACVAKVIQAKARGINVN